MKNSVVKEDDILLFHVDASYDSIIALKDESFFLLVNDKSKKLSHTQIPQLKYDRGSRKFEEELGTNVSTEKLLTARGFFRDNKLTIAGVPLFYDKIPAYA